jgi:hypothetical protein
MNREENIRLFRRLDRLFWLIWILFPITIWTSARDFIDLNAARALMTPEQISCLDVMPYPLNYSTTGKVTFWSLFLINYLILVPMIGVLHQTLHRFGKGLFFVTDTLNAFYTLGIFIIGWAFYQSFSNNLLGWMLFKTGDLQVFQPDYNIELVPLAVGIFIVSFRFIIGRAIAMQSELDLTV